MTTFIFHPESVSLWLKLRQPGSDYDGSKGADRHTSPGLSRLRNDGIGVAILSEAMPALARKLGTSRKRRIVTRINRK